MSRWTFLGFLLVMGCASLVGRVQAIACPPPATLLQRGWSAAYWPCWKALITQLLGYAVVAGATTVKLPQIITLLRSHSAAGLSHTTYLVETFGYAYNLAFHIRAGYPVSTYGDFLMLGVQNLFILALLFTYTDRMAPRGWLVLSAFVAGTLLCAHADSPVPLVWLERLCGLNVAIVIASRLPQIYANWQRQSTGNLSLPTCVGLFGGATARVLTTLQSVKNNTILAGYVVSALLNLVLVLQIVLLGSQPKTATAATSATADRRPSTGVPASTREARGESKKQQ